MVLEESLGFDSVAIKQEKNVCLSRLDANIESEVIKGIKLHVPLIAANMSTVTNADFCILLSKLGAMGVLHRAESLDNILVQVAKIAKECEHVAVSVGVNESALEDVKDMVGVGANIVFIDIAHGYCDPVISLGRAIKADLPHVKVVLGNAVNTGLLLETFEFADAIKVGIGQGFACETKNTAGCTEKQFSAVLKFKELSRQTGVPIISDGGTRESADFVKAIAAGANSVMAGKIFAECPESAAKIVDGKKLYAGMASVHVQELWRGGLKPGTCAEGGVRYLEIGMTAEELLETYSGALRSGISYSGGRDIKSFQEMVSFVRLV
jgi:IMP dehydrogenase